MKPSAFLQTAIYEIHDACVTSGAPEWADGESALQRHTLLYMTSGEAHMRVDGAETELCADSVYMYEPGVAIELRKTTKADFELYWISFDLFRLSDGSEQRKCYTRERSFPAKGRIKVKGSRCKRLFDLLVSDGLRAADSNRFASQQYLHDMLEELLYWASPPEANDVTTRLQLTVSYMQQHYREDIRIEELAELAQLHPSYYSQMFKQTMDKTPVAFLAQLRMNRAKEMLIQTDKSVRDIASEVGYGDEFYFSRRFKEVSGVSPTLYMKNNEWKIVSLSAPYTDHFFTLGHMPSAGQLHAYADYRTKSLVLPEHGADTWEMNRQAFIDINPDLIVCKDNVLVQAREHINDIAPIISIPWTTKDVYSHLMDIAELIGRKQAARRWQDDHERRSEQARAKVRRVIGGGSVALCVMRSGELRMYGARNIGHVLYRSLQLTPPELTGRQINRFSPGTGYNWTSIEADELSRYEADFLFIATRTESDRQRVLELIGSNATWRRYPAVQTKRIYLLEWEKWKLYAPSMLDKLLEELPRLLFSLAPLELI